MIQSDIYAVLRWWLLILILGTGFLPLTFYIFKNFFDKGYIFSKVFSIAFTSYVIFLLGVLHILPFTQSFSFVAFLLLVVLFVFFIPGRNEWLPNLKKHWKIYIFEEILFLSALFFWSYIRSFNPDIHGLEKYMDFGFLNSILRAKYFPPKDMWFTPFPINYYYFGHLATAVLTKLSGIPSRISFNLMLSTIFALCLLETFSIGANLYAKAKNNVKYLSVKRIMAGLLAAALVTFAGNLHILYGFFKPYDGDNPVPFWKLPFMPFTFPNSYWYPNATRFIYHTIHEFPIYSWVVADLHGHVLDIPFVLLTIAVLLSMFIKSEANSASQYQQNKALFSNFRHLGVTLNLLLIGFLLAIMYMTNAWDGGIYLLLAGLVLFCKYTNKLASFFISIAVVFVSLIVFSMPYSFFFKPFASGIGILCAPSFLTKIGKIGPFLFETNHCQHSYWWELLTLYGFFYFFVLSFGIFISRTKKLLNTDIFVFLLIILSTFIIILPEFIYLKDIYPAHYRANTMFKLVFQAFIMLSLSCGYVLFRVASTIKDRSVSKYGRFFAALFLLLAIPQIALVLTYPRLAINSYYGLDQKEANGQPKKPLGLDGLTYLQKQYPSDYEAIMWLNKKVKDQPVILEAQSDSYTDYARVSANTGLPTVLGWTVHEWLWRGTYDIPAPRITDVRTLYETTDENEAKNLLKKYNVAYVFIGTLEYQKYPALSEDKFQKFGKKVFQNQNTKIYKVSN